MDIIAPGYLQEVKDVDWVHEVLSETFDGVLELMTPHSVVYGGAIRDCLAGLPLVGDLDIAVSQQEFSDLSNRIQTSPKWLPADKDVVAHWINSSDEEGPIKKKWTPFDSPRPIRDSKGMARELAPMSSITGFVGPSGREVQLIMSKQHTKDPFQDAAYMARMVDIVCCAVIMTYDGRVFEVIRGALEDCRKRVLRLNEESETIYIEALPHRVEKLVGRGWTNEIDVEKAMATIKRKQEREKKRRERAMMSARRKAVKGPVAPELAENIEIISLIGDVSNPQPPPEGPSFRFDPEEVHRMMGTDRESVVESLNNTAMASNVNAIAKLSPLGHVTLTFSSSTALHHFRHMLMTSNMKKAEKKRPMAAKKAEMVTAYGGGLPKFASTGVSTGRLKARVSEGFLKFNPEPDTVKLALSVPDEESGTTIEVVMETTQEKAREINRAWQSLSPADRKAFIDSLVQEGTS